MKTKKKVELKEIQGSACCQPELPPQSPCRRGPTGPTGPTGPRGFMGIMGPTGPEGTIRPAAAVATLVDGATTNEIITKINELLTSLRAGGFLSE